MMIVVEDSGNHHLSKFVKIEYRVHLIISISSLHAPCIDPTWDEPNVQIIIK